MIAPVSRRLDTGLRRGADNVVIDHALMAAGTPPDAPGRPRFHGDSRCVSVGAFDNPSEASRADCYHSAGVEVVRRLSGGAALRLDPDQPCFRSSFVRVAVLFPRCVLLRVMRAVPAA